MERVRRLAAALHLAAAEQKLAAMRALATRHTTVHLGMPDFRTTAGRLAADSAESDTSAAAIAEVAGLPAPGDSGR
ncbi:hypothetical protein [Streptomyces rugosispiralis]|uniref:Uncharacterized protein n=1 Tax=Streptomyces rugosispiralis TaxID=2967341 RepID=A0ABT1VBG8_9ACTN|nr:hypothetical protein [Streptomyces rugosispiralis]MCQ8194323.1 hypothetical protein [Streptomyces rugosispiralis]